MSGYTYFGVIDFDEFLIPSKNRSLKELLVSCDIQSRRVDRICRGWIRGGGGGGRESASPEKSLKM